MKKNMFLLEGHKVSFNSRFAIFINSTKTDVLARSSKLFDIIKGLFCKLAAKYLATVYLVVRQKGRPIQEN